MDKRAKMLMISIGVLAGIFFLLQIVYDPWKAKWDKVGAEIVRTKAALNSTQDVAKREPEVEARWGKMKERLDRPERAGIETGFMSVVNPLVTAVDAKPGFEQRNIERNGDFREIIVDAHMTCTTEGLTDFLISAYNSPEFLRIRRLAITSQYDRSEKKLSVDTKMSTIVYAPKPNTKP